MKVEHLSGDEIWLIWGTALTLLMLVWYAFRSKALLTQMQSRLTSLTVELKKANHSIAILLNSRSGVANDEDLDETKLYVGNIDYSASEKELAAHFAKFGQIETVNIPVDRYTGRARGFGFITFKKVADAIKAMDLDGSEFKGRSIQVNFARERVPST